MTIAELIDRFLTAQKAKVESGELADATFRDYYGAANRIDEFFGGSRFVEDLRGDDFDRFKASLAKSNGIVGLKNQITRTRIIFNYADRDHAGLIEQPVLFGGNFKAPTAKVVRKHKARSRQESPRMFAAAEIRRMLDHADATMKAMISLGVNAGFGCADVGRLPIGRVDLDAGWIEFPRPKTGSKRRVPLWPETIDAIRESLRSRPNPAGEHVADLLFLTASGASWHKETTRYVSEQFRELLDAIDQAELKAAEKEHRKPLGKLYIKGRGFYAFRHVFETIGGESRDQIAVDAIMGHERGDMGSEYREGISDARLERVVNVVREWLYAEPEAADDDAPATVPFRVVG